MSKLESELTLPVGPARALTACRGAVESLGWSIVVDESELLAAVEDATRLVCCASPARVEMRFTGDSDVRILIRDRLKAGDSDDQTRLTLTTEVPGYGPIASRNVRNRDRAVALGIARRVTDPDGSGWR